MSLILDALKKVDRERGAHRLPTRASAPTGKPGHRWPLVAHWGLRPRQWTLSLPPWGFPAQPWPVWVWLAAGGVVFNAAALLVGVWLMAAITAPEGPRPGSSPAPPAAPLSAPAPASMPTPEAAPATASAPAATANATVPSPPGVVPSRMASTPATSTPSDVSSVPPVGAHPGAASVPPPASILRGAAAATSAHDSAAVPAPTTEAPTARARPDPPPGPRAEDLTLEVVVYAEAPEERSAWINGRRYVEGQRLPGGFVVETIRRDAVVLRGQGPQTVLLQQE